MSDTKNLICLIEDNNAIRKLIATILKKDGFEIQDFANGKSAIEWLKNNEASCVIIDILLPDINGTEILPVVRAIDAYKDTPLVALTGFAQSSDKNKYLEMGFDDYFSKPINTANFGAEVKRIISSK